MFDEVVFPLMMDAATSAPEYSTTVIPTRSGAEQRIVNWTDARITFNAAMGVRSKLDIVTLLNFFRARKGRARGFLVKDLLDYEADGDIFGTGNGTTKEFQLVRVYGDAANSDIRPIFKPIEGTVDIWRNDGATNTKLTAGGYGAKATAAITTQTVDSVITVTSGGTGYSSVPTVGFSGGGGTGAAATVTLTATGGITNILVTNRGSGYTSNPSVQISAPDSGGEQAYANAVRLGESVNMISVTTAGSGYRPVIVKVTGGNGSGAVIKAVTSGGSITGYTVIDGGSGYTTAPTIEVSAPATGGTQAVPGTVTRVGGVITAVALGNGGSGYNPPTVTIGAPTGGTPVQATATADVGLSVATVTRTNAGSGYTSAPQVVFQGGGGTGAAATCTISGGAISGITLNAGGANYSTAPTVQISAPSAGGVQAVATATINATTKKVTGFSISNAGSGYDEPPTITLVNNDGDYSLNYKTGLVTFRTAPTTGHILSWYGQFYIPCRFVEDRLPADEVFFDLVENRAAGTIPNIDMIEIRDIE